MSGECIFVLELLNILNSLTVENSIIKGRKEGEQAFLKPRKLLIGRGEYKVVQNLKH